MNLEDIAQDIAAKLEGREQQRRGQLRQQAAVGVAMQDLVIEPKWKVYADHIEAVRQRHEQSKASLEQQLADGKFLANEEYGQIRIDLAREKAWCEALMLSLTITKTLIDNGEFASAAIGEAP